MDYHAERSLARLLPRLEACFASGGDSAAWHTFKARLESHFGALFPLLRHLYGGHYDFFYHLENILSIAAENWLSRPPALQELDKTREADPDWFLSEKMLGAMLYVDLFAGDLEGVRVRIPYFKELGLTYLHLMPLFLAPEGNNDGGYAVSSYREVNPALGTMQQLAALAAELREHGISLVLDFVLNHTSDEHTWAKKAIAGDPEYQDYYLMFPDRLLPDAYQATLREIFPDQRPGNFTWRADISRWVWTTFNSFQWDLNYSNPAVFAQMMDEMLFLANQGVEILRFDAVAFMWKRMGTSCENLPEVHMLIRALNALARIAAPSLLFKSEAIVHPRDVNAYVSPEECQLSYNPLMMALLWNTLATRDVRLLRDSMQESFKLGPHTAWVNYVRVHDDIGWTFDDDIAWRFGMNGYDHRRFLNDFFTGRFSGSFARGLPFGENPRTGDARISGTGASLSGLELAAQTQVAEDVELSIKRILLIHSIILSMGGIPLLYMGDEIGTLNDYTYRQDPAKAGDSRWVHRPATDWDKMERRHDPNTTEGRIYGELSRLISLRKEHTMFAGQETRVFDTGNDRVFGYVHSNGGQLLAIANFSEHPQTISANQLRLYGLSYTFTDLVSGKQVSLNADVTLEPYRFMWLVPGE